MSWRTTKTVVLLRNIGRRLGINSKIASLFEGGRYEDRFQSALLGAIQCGDVVWDVGANVGLYSVQFANLVGSRGMVIAFEPSPKNLHLLEGAVVNAHNVLVMPFGLGERDELMQFNQGEDEFGATSHFSTSPNESSQCLMLQVLRGDSLINSRGVPVPNVIKIDVEGNELDVLMGMPQILANRILRSICIEVHFGLLELRGTKNVPAKIEAMLTRFGFLSTWTDSSHIVAVRNP